MVLLCIVLTNFNTAYSKDSLTIFQTIYNDEEVPKLIITTDLKKIQKYKLKPYKYPSSVEIQTSGDTSLWNVVITTRGKSRKKICNWPPLKLKFDKSELKDNNLKSKYRSLKLVSICKNSKTYEQYILREYLAYKMYNQLTPYSFKTQLVQIEYRDINKKLPPVTRYGFFIENTKEMAKRLKAKEKEVYELKRDSVDTKNYNTVCLFQYMIANADYKVNIMHNIKIIKEKKTDTYYIIPYDFDYSGIVNTNYAVPDVRIGQRDVMQKIYMGDPESIKSMDSTADLFIEKEADIRNSIQHVGLNEKTQKKINKFLNSFFKMVKNPKKLQKCLKSSLPKTNK